MSTIEKLIKAAEKFGESPLDFYDHLMVAKKNAAISPIYRQSLEKGEKYDEESDPYVKACKYYKESALAGIQDPEEILALSREEVVQRLDLRNPKSLNTLFDKLGSITYSFCDEVLDWKNLQVSVEFMETLRNENKLNQQTFETFVRESRVLFRKTLEEDLLNSEKSNVKKFIQENTDAISEMKKISRQGSRTVRVKKKAWSKVEIFRPSNSDNLSTHDLVRGVYLLVLKFVLDKKGQ